LNVPTNTVYPIGNSVYNGVIGTCNSIALSNTNVFVGGSFPINLDTCGNIFYMNNTGIWNMNNVWSTMGATAIRNGLNSICYAIEIDSSNQQIYVGGNFANAIDYYSTTNVRCIAKWSIKDRIWTTILGGSSGFEGSPVQSLLYDNDRSILYITGGFLWYINPDNSSPYYSYDFAIADIKNNTWILIGTVPGSIEYGLSNVAGNDAYALAIDGSKNVYIGGLFSKPIDRVGTKTISNVTIWNNSTSVFLPFGDVNQNGIDGSCNALLIDVSNQKLYVGGAFKNARDSSNTSLSSNNVSIWNALTKRWIPFGLDASNANKCAM